MLEVLTLQVKHEIVPRIAEEYGVAVLDGSFFGAGGDGLIRPAGLCALTYAGLLLRTRISFAQSRERLAEGCAMSLEVCGIGSLLHAAIH